MHSASLGARPYGMLPTCAIDLAVRSLLERSAYLVYMLPTKLMQTHSVKLFKIPAQLWITSRLSSWEQIQDNDPAKSDALLSDLSTGGERVQTATTQTCC